MAGVFGDSGRPPAGTIEDSGNAGRPPARHTRKPYHSKEAYKHEQIARHITPTVTPPEKTWCIFFFDEEPHFCRIMRQGGRVTVANGTQGIRLNG